MFRVRVIRIGNRPLKRIIKDFRCFHERNFVFLLVLAILLRIPFELHADLFYPAVSKGGCSSRQTGPGADVQNVEHGEVSPTTRNPSDLEAPTSGLMP